MRRALRKRYGYAPARRSTLIAVLERNRWIEDYSQTDPCLYEVLVQAYVAKHTAEDTNGDSKVIAVGDRILHEIRDRRVQGQRACARATAAMRKFDEAYMGKRVRS